MDKLLQDLRFGVRTFVRAPALTAAAIVALALGTGATTAIFSVLDGIVLRRCPTATPSGWR